MKKLASLLMTPLLCLFGPLGATTFAVDTVLDFQDFSCNDGSCSLRDALQIANSGDTITVPPGMYLLQLGQLVIDQNLTLLGDMTAPVVIDGGGTSRLLRVVAESKVAISNMEFQNGYQDDTFEPNDNFWFVGGGIFNSGYLELTNVTVQENRSLAYFGQGGGIYNQDTLIMNNCRVLDNEVTGYGGGITSSNGAYLRINNCFINGNLARAGEGSSTGGGGMSVVSNTIITNSTLSNNRTEDGFQDSKDCSYIGGGAIFVVSDGLLLTNREIIFENVTISGNYSGNIGGGILISSEDPFADFSNDFYAINCTIVNNESERMGGGIKNCINGVLHLVSTIVANNTSGQGGQDLDNFEPIAVNQNNLVIDCVGECPVFAITSDPLLGELGDYGGFAPVHLPAPNSPVIDAGNCLQLTNNIDQRGNSRPVDFSEEIFPNASEGCDIGAVEVTEADIVSTENINGEERVHIYPNPTSDRFHIIGIPSETISSIRCFDALGRLVNVDYRPGYPLELTPAGYGLFTLQFTLKGGQIIYKQVIRY